MYHFPVYGIDLGSSNSCISLYRNGKLEAVEIGNDRTVPSCIAYTEQKCLIGSAAKDEEYRSSCIIFNKRIKGRCYAECQDFITEMRYPFDICCDSFGYPVYRLPVGDHFITKTPLEVDIDFLRELIRLAVENTGIPCEYFVVTYPAFFDERQKSVTQQAAASLGPNCQCIGLLPEPVAAAEAASLPQSLHPRNVLVYDFGGGTFDVCILESQLASFTVKQCHGDTTIGGCDIDNCIFKRVYDYVSKNYQCQRLNSNKCLVELLSRCEQAKIDLSSRTQAEIDLSFLGIEDRFVLTHYEFGKILKPFLKKSTDCCEQVIQNLPNHSLSSSDDSIILVGGTSRIPAIKDQLISTFGVKVFDNINPDVIVSFGAARYGINIYCKTINPNIPNPFPDIPIQLMALHDIGISFDSFGRKVIPVINIGDLAETPIPVQIQAGFKKSKLHVFSREKSTGPWKYMGVISIPGITKKELTMMIDRNGMVQYEYTTSILKKVVKGTIATSQPIPADQAEIIQKRYLRAMKYREYLEGLKAQCENHPRKDDIRKVCNDAIGQFFGTDAVRDVEEEAITNYFNEIYKTLTCLWSAV